MSDTALAAGIDPVHIHHDVIVNGEEIVVHQNAMTFEQVCLLAFPNGPFGENIVYTVTYTYASWEGDHILNKGQTVAIKNRMVFNVGNTDRS